VVVFPGKNNKKILKKLQFFSPTLGENTDFFSKFPIFYPEYIVNGNIISQHIYSHYQRMMHFTALGKNQGKI